MPPRPPLPPFNAETVRQKIRMAEDAWNSRDPVRVSLAYTEDSIWRNRDEFFSGRDAIVAFLVRKWAKEGVAGTGDVGCGPLALESGACLKKSAQKTFVKWGH